MALVINLLSVESFDSWSKILDRIYRSPYRAEAVFLNIFGAQESILPA